MTAAGLTCLCGEPLRPTGNFCGRCGREIRQDCPACFEERRPIAKCDPLASPWCDVRGELLLACKRCGRWLPADARQCPDPDCRGSVDRTWPASTGKAADGTGRTGLWTWPAVWDRQNPLYTAPRQEAWTSDTPVHAAFVAHGRLYVWAGTTLLAPEGPAGGPLAETSVREAKTAWRCWLRLDGEPDARLSAHSRVALVGGGAVLAAQNDFLLAGLCPQRNEDVVPLGLGTPTAQAASEGWWVGWSRRDGRPALWAAPIAAEWRSLDCQQIMDVPAGSAPRENSPPTLCGGIASWVGEDGALWQLDVVSRRLQPLHERLPGLQRVWCKEDGVYTVRTTGEGLRVGLNAVVRDGANRETPGGVGPFRDLFAATGLIAVVGETVTTLDAQTGDTLGNGRYSGQWITGALTDAPPNTADREPRLLMLTYESDAGSLSALRPSSGGEEAVWREAGVRPMNLIVAGESLYVVHARGVTRIQEASP